MDGTPSTNREQLLRQSTEPRFRRISVAMTNSLHSRLLQLSQQEGRTLSNMASRLLEKAIEEHDHP